MPLYIFQIFVGIRKIDKSQENGSMGAGFIIDEEELLSLMKRSFHGSPYHVF